MKGHVAVLGRSDQHNVFKILQTCNKPGAYCFAQVVSTHSLCFAHISQTCPGERKSGKIADTPVESLNEGLWVWDRGKRLCKLEGRGRL